MEYTITYNTPFYYLKVRRVFLWFKYWEVVEYSHDFNYIERLYTESIPK